MYGSEDLRDLKIAFSAYILFYALKLAGYFIIGVMALIAEALHTLSDIFVSGFLLLAAYYLGKSADRVNMFSYDRGQNLVALSVAILFISFTSFNLYEKFIPHLFNPWEAVYENLWLAVGVIGVSIAIAAISLIKLYTQNQRGPVANAQFLEFINDGLGLISALVGTFLFCGVNCLSTQSHRSSLPPLSSTTG